MRTSVVILLAALIGPLACEARGDDWTPGTYLAQAMGRVMGSVRMIGDQTEFGYDGPDTICFMGGYFRPGSTIGFDRDLDEGVEYAFIGGGDDDAVDVDLSLYDAQGNLLAEDTKEDAAPMILFTVPRTGTYTINVKLYEAPSACFCALAILRRGGVDVPTENVVKATANLFDHCTAISQKVEQTGFNSEENQWAVWGAIYSPGQQLTFNNVRLPKGTNVAIAAGDTQTIDIDVHLLAASGKTLAEDVLEDAEPRVVYNVSGAFPSYQVATTNASSKGPTLIMTAILVAE